ncbi:MAG TPA: ATP-binding protein [Actinomycetes bacterium]|nr:ATP-binding protein [Actinomycetes bacterium]
MEALLAVLVAGVAALVLGWTWRTRLRSVRRRDSTVLDTAVLRELRLGVVVVDAAGDAVLANDAARAMGLLRGQALSIPELRTLADKTRRTGHRHEQQVQLLHGWLPRDPVAVLAKAAPADRAGQVVLVVEDITEAHRLAEMRRDFVINVSHELKTPVGALALLAEALQAASDDPDAVRRFAGRIEHESVRLGRLVSELIDLSRLEGAEPLPEPTPVRVGQVVAEAADRAQAMAEMRSVSLVADGDLDATILGNRAQLVTAVANLLDNAIRYSSDGMTVSTTVRRKPGGQGVDLDAAAAVEIAVTDTGVGIAEEDLERVFERFYRVDKARSGSGAGTGLGLAIVKHVAANHGGRVGVFSRVRSGSTFTITLPAAPMLEDRSIQAPTQEASA